MPSCRSCVAVILVWFTVAVAAVSGDHPHQSEVLWCDEEPAAAAAAASEREFTPLFDGHGLDGFDGDPSLFRVEDGAIVGGSLQAAIPHNFFLSTKDEYADFELRLQFKLIGDKTNAGVQIRSQRIPDHHEMIGYQADLGAGYWGALYDESRRNKVLAAPSKETIEMALKPGEWNDYRILCEGRRIQLWINDVPTVDYTEPDDAITQTGLIALQIHGGPAGEAHYRRIRIRPITK